MNQSLHILSVLTTSVATVYHTAVLLQYHWLYSLCLTFRSCDLLIPQLEASVSYSLSPIFTHSPNPLSICDHFWMNQFGLAPLFPAAIDLKNLMEIYVSALWFMSERGQYLRSQMFAENVSFEYIYRETKLLKLIDLLPSSSASYSPSLTFEPNS